MPRLRRDDLSLLGDDIVEEFALDQPAHVDRIAWKILSDGWNPQYADTNLPARSPKLTSSQRQTQKYPVSEAEISANVSTVNGRTSRRPKRANCTQWSVRLIERH